MQTPNSYSFLRRGKVRDVYSAGDDHHLLIVASDRISAFDHVLSSTIPDKGMILTRLSNFWFDQTKHLIGNHLVDKDPPFVNWIEDERWKREDLQHTRCWLKKPYRCPLRQLFGVIWLVPVGKSTAGPAESVD